MIVIKVALLILLCWLQINFFLGKNGLFEYIKLNKQILQKKLEIFYLVERNVKLLSEIQCWHNSNELIEEYARGNLGMIKKDEIFYRILIDN